jgi:ABC-type lipoprotein export system ATPase subunit
MGADARAAHSTPAFDAAIEARGLYHIYRESEVETVALRGASLALARGRWTSLMGPSGSGKSTLMQVMAGLLQPSGGAVMVDGRDLTRLPPPERARWRRSRIGVLLQRDNLHPLLNVADNVALPLRIDGRNAAAEIAPRVQELLSRLGVSAHARHAAGSLSGGEAQRAALAVALAPRPEVLLADEPTGELDEATAAEVLDLLSDACERDGTTILTVTHNAQVAERAHRRVAMRDGLVLDDG